MVIMVEDVHKVGQKGIIDGRGVKGNGNAGRGTMKPGREVTHHDNKSQCYAFEGKNKVEMTNTVITCTILVVTGWIVGDLIWV